MLNTFNSETPAEKAKKRPSMAERMIDPDALQIRPSPTKLVKGKKPEDLVRLDNDVLNLNEQPANVARRMTLPQKDSRADVYTKLAVVQQRSHGTYGSS